MSTTVTAPAPRVKRTVTEESFVSPADKPKWFAFPDEFLEFIASSTEAELQKYIIYVYRLKDRESRNAEGSYIDKLIPTKDFDESYLKTKAGADGQGFGGGFFKIILKDAAGQRRSQGVWEIAGAPRDAGAGFAIAAVPGVAGVDGNTAVSLEALKMAGNPQTMAVMMQMMINASNHAMSMIREQMPKQMDPLEMIRLMKELQPAPPAAPPVDPFADLMRSYMMDMMKRSMEPGDPLASIKNVSGILSAVKEFSGANVKADWSSTLLANLPALADKFVGGIREYRLASEAQARIPQPGAPVQTSRTIDLDQQPPPQAPANPSPVAQTTAQPQATDVHPGSLPWFLLKLEAGIMSPEATGEELYEFVGSCKVTGLIAETDFNVLTSDKATVAATLQTLYNHVFGENNEHLKRITADPARLEKLLDEYLAVAALDKVPASAATPPAPKPN